MKKGPAASRPGQHAFWGGPLRHRQGDLFHVLAGGCQQALPRYLHETAEPRISVPVQLFGIRKRALHRLLAPLVDRLAPRRLAVTVRPLARLRPDMPRDGAHRLRIAGAGGPQRTVAAMGGIGPVVPVAVAVGGGVAELLARRAAVAI